MVAQSKAAATNTNPPLIFPNQHAKSVSNYHIPPTNTAAMYRWPIPFQAPSGKAIKLSVFHESVTSNKK